jgi:hypothetical protein
VKVGPLIRPARPRHLLGFLGHTGRSGRTRRRHRTARTHAARRSLAHGTPWPPLPWLPGTTPDNTVGANSQRPAGKQFQGTAFHGRNPHRWTVGLLSTGILRALRPAVAPRRTGTPVRVDRRNRSPWCNLQPQFHLACVTTTGDRPDAEPSVEDPALNLFITVHM